MTGNEQRELGVLTATVDALEKRIEKLEATVEQSHDLLTKLSGAWKLALIVAAIVGTIVGWVFQSIPFFHKPPL